MSTSSFDHRAAVLQNLIEIRELRGRVPMHLSKAVAEMLGTSHRSLRRWVLNGAPPPPNPRASARFEMSDDAIALFMEVNGNVTAMHEAMLDRDFPEVPSRRTLNRAVRRLPAATRASAKEGAMARRTHEAYLRMQTSYRNEVWQTDHKQLDIKVIPPVALGRQPMRPWITVFIDDFTRVITGYAISYNPDSGAVIAAFHAAVRMDPDWGPFGGVPDTVVCDQGKDFLAESVSEVALTIGTDLRPLPPYHPWLKGKVERFNRTIDQKFIARLPGYMHGPRRNDNKLYGPSELMTDATFRQRLHEFVRSYNFEHAHRELDDMTPKEFWELDPTPLRIKTDEDLAWMMRPSKPAQVRRGAIQFMKRRFMNPALTNLDGESVEIRYTPGDKRSIDVFYNGSFLCQAVPDVMLPPDDQAAIMERRAEERRRDSVQRRRATARQRSRVVPAQGDQPAELAAGLTAEEARQDGLRRGARRAAEVQDLDGLLDETSLNQALEDD